MAKKSTASKKILWIFIIVSCIFIALFIYGKFFYPVARVNGVRITQTQYLQELQRLDRKMVLDGMINRILVYQEAKKRKIIVSQKEIDEEIKKMEDEFKKQKKTFEMGLKEQSLDKNIVIERIKFNKTLEKLIANEVKVNEAEIDDFVAKNSATFAQQPMTQEIRNRVREYLRQQKVRTKTKELITSLRKKATIQYSVQ